MEPLGEGKRSGHVGAGHEEAPGAPDLGANWLKWSPNNHHHVMYKGISWRFPISVLNAIKSKTKILQRKKKVAAILSAYSGQITLSSERGEFGSAGDWKLGSLTSHRWVLCKALCLPTALKAPVLHTHSPHPPTRDILTKLQQLSSAWGHRGKQDCAAWQARVSPTWMQKIRLGRFCCQLSNFIFWFCKFLWCEFCWNPCTTVMCHHRVTTAPAFCQSAPWGSQHGVLDATYCLQHAWEAAGGCSWEDSLAQAALALNRAYVTAAYGLRASVSPTHCGACKYFIRLLWGLNKLKYIKSSNPACSG